MILRSFSKAHDALKSRMKSLATSHQPEVCFLDTIISACYDEYAEQRAQLRAIFERETRFEPYLRLLTPPPPPPEESSSESEYDPEDAPAPPPPPPLPELKSEASTISKPSKEPNNRRPNSKKQKKEGKRQDRKERKKVAAQDRTKRLKLLLPHRASEVKDEVGHEEAFLFSGYEKRSKFWSDMAQVTKKPLGA